MKRIFHVLILVLLVSCSKTEIEPGTYKGDYTLKGTVRDEISGKPIPYASAMILQRHRDQTWGNQVLAQAQADSMGQFELLFYADTKDYIYSLDAQALTYFDKHIDGSDKINFSKDQIIQQDVKLIPQAYVTLNIKGTNGGPKLYINGAGGPYYQGVDTIKTIVEIPNQEFKVVCFIYNFKDSLLEKRIHTPPPSPPHDTTYYLIEF